MRTVVPKERIDIDNHTNFYDQLADCFNNGMDEDGEPFYWQNLAIM
jgi:hypothetical protein